MNVLGIESTAHTFGIGIASDKGDIIFNENSIYVPITGGIHPREAAEHHSKVASNILFLLRKKGIDIASDIDGIAVALGPGMGPCLRVGATLARFLAIRYSKPLIPVNHAVAHVEIARLSTGFKDPLVLYIAGGNTMITTYVEGRYRIFGETLDIPLGNCIDTFAREIGLSMPGVPKVEGLAEKGNKFINLPYTVKGQDLSFSGLLTAAISAYKKGFSVNDVAYSLIEVAYSMVVEVTERALSHTGKKEITLTGGVARSKKLISKLKTMSELHDVEFKPVDPRYAGDNGAMIAYTGALALRAGIKIEIEESFIRPMWRIDEVDIVWFDD